MAKPGIMLYFDVKEPLKTLSYSDKGRLLDAILEYGEHGTEPRFRGMLAMAWGFLRPKLDRDETKYKETVLKRQYAVFCRELKKKGDVMLSFEEWRALSEEEREEMLSCDIERYPTATATATTTTTTTTTTTATAAAAATATPTETDDAATAATDRELKKIQGKLGKGVVVLSDHQIEILLDKMGLDMFDFYVDKLSSFIIKNDAKVKSHYATILKWWMEDSGDGGAET